MPRRAPELPELTILPDTSRVEHALIDAASRAFFVDASAYLSFSQLIDACQPSAALGRRPCSPLDAQVVLGSLAVAMPVGPYGRFVADPAFARGALQLF